MVGNERFERGRQSLGAELVRDDIRSQVKALQRSGGRSADRRKFQMPDLSDIAASFPEPRHEARNSVAAREHEPLIGCE